MNAQDLTQDIAGKVAESEARFLDSALLFCSINGLIDKPAQLEARYAWGTTGFILALELYVKDSFIASMHVSISAERNLHYQYKAPSTFALISRNQDG